MTINIFRTSLPIKRSIFLKSMLYWCTFIGSLVSVNAVSAADILTTTPVTYMLASELTKNTDITSSYVPPKRYGIERLPNWFSGKGQEKVLSEAQAASAVITLSAIWPADPLFKFARQANIRIVEIDASQAISPRAQGVAALTLPDGTVSKYAWLNPTNISRMSAIVSDDLKRLWPHNASQIESNQQRLMLSVRQLINAQQRVLMEANVDSVVLLSSALEDFASGNQLFVVDRLTMAELEWSEREENKLKRLIEDDPTIWFLTASTPSKRLLSLVPKSQILQVDTVERWGRAGIRAKNPLERWYISPLVQE